MKEKWEAFRDKTGVFLSPILFFISLFTSSSRLCMNSEIMELDWQRTENVTENIKITQLQLTKLGIKLRSQLLILHPVTNLPWSEYS